MEHKLFENFDVKKLLPLVNGLRGYHSHKTHGIEHIPLKGPGLIVSSHSLATYDLLLLFAAILEERSRMVRPMMDRLFTKIPILVDFVEALGARVGSQKNGLHLLARGELVVVAPGGMREALRPSTEKYQLRWQDRKGFIKLAIEAQVPVILTCCPKADDLYEIQESKITEFAYKNLKIPVPIAFGLSFSLIPKPIELHHLINKPIKPPKKMRGKEKFAEQVDDFHGEITEAMEALIKKALTLS